LPADSKPGGRASTRNREVDARIVEHRSLVGHCAEHLKSLHGELGRDGVLSWAAGVQSVPQAGPPLARQQLSVR
jgi:hypothetical protein